MKTFKFSRSDIDYIKSMYFEERVTYPLTVITDRYNGCYSGAKYTAWPLPCDMMPKGPESGDILCMSFWEDADKRLIGMGDSIFGAVNDLFNKLRNFSDEEWTLKDI